MKDIQDYELIQSNENLKEQKRDDINMQKAATFKTVNLISSKSS